MKLDIELCYYEDECGDGCCVEDGYIVDVNKRSLGKIPDDAEIILSYIIFDLKLTKHPGEITIWRDIKNDTNEAIIYLKDSPVGKVKNFRDVEEVLRVGISSFNKYTKINIEIVNE